ncbi:MAG: hypothetical protein R2699_02185 [Acidimicrobiales bacterium]
MSYGAAKAALISYTLSAAAEMAGDGVHNVVYPPVTDTGWITDDVRAFVAGATTSTATSPRPTRSPRPSCGSAQANHLVTGNVIRLR